MCYLCDCPRAGLPWLREEDELLEEYFDKGLTIDDLAWVHQRTTGAITSRLQRLGRVEYENRCYFKIDRTLIYEV